MNKIKTTIMLTAMCLSLNGCFVAGIGAGVGAWKYGNAEKTKAETTCKEAYNTYLENIKSSSIKPLTLEQYCPSK